MDVAFEPTVDLGIYTGDSGSTTVSFDLQIDESSVALGTATLDYAGNLSGSGLYAPVNFSAPDFYDDMWHTSYIGGPIDLQFPVNSFFDIFFEVTIDEPHASFGSNTTHAIVATLPDGYELIPEPASFVSLLVPTELALLLRRKR